MNNKRHFKFGFKFVKNNLYILKDKNLENDVIIEKNNSNEHSFCLTGYIHKDQRLCLQLQDGVK